jgi:4a-hydroxytetrahydrobiopterin dehydratase
MTDLSQKHCKACEGGVAPLSRHEAEHMLLKLEGWELNPEATEIRRLFAFKNYYHTMAFVNALAYIAHTENHHPDLEVFYNRTLVRYSTHAIGGLSENDFICAAKADLLIKMTRKD